VNKLVEEKKHTLEKVRGAIRDGEFIDEACGHLETIQAVTPSADGCEDCLKTGDGWVHLRMCLICGYVGCCDNSKNKHATRHYRATQHAMIMSFEPGENWLWCYADRASITPTLLNENFTGEAGAES
jgi:uncharacterized UBP type Zn finger protein